MNFRLEVKLSILFTCLVLNLSCQSQSSENNKLVDLKQAIANKTYPKIDGIIVKKSGEVIVEEYFGKFDSKTRHDTRSAFKSITSILTGIAIDKGLITLEDRVLNYFPNYQFQDENDKKKASMTVKDILEMKAGFVCEEFYDIGPDCENDMWSTDDWIKYAINVPMKDTPGLNWSYSSNEPVLMGAIITRASGRSVMDFAKEYLFEPLQISNYEWTTSPKGQAMTAGSFYMKPVDMLKIGQLVKQGGKWKGNQIVSEQWIKQSTDCNIDIDFSFLRYARLSNAKYESAHYGFYWYREKLNYAGIETEVLFASGNGGQYIMILEEYDAVVIFTGSNYGNWRGKLPFEILLKYLIPMMSDQER